MLSDSISYFEARSRNKSTASFKAQIIVVDDGSKDSTLAVVETITKKLNPKCTAVGSIRFPKNMGKGAATAEVQSCLLMIMFYSAILGHFSIPRKYGAVCRC